MGFSLFSFRINIVKAVSGRVESLDMNKPLLLPQPYLPKLLITIQLQLIENLKLLS